MCGFYQVYEFLNEVIEYYPLLLQNNHTKSPPHLIYVFLKKKQITKFVEKVEEKVLPAPKFFFTWSMVPGLVRAPEAGGPPAAIVRVVPLRHPL